MDEPPGPDSRGSVALSIVIPVYGCGDCLRALHARLTASIASITSSYELIFVDDRSRDDAWSVLCDLADADHTVHLLRLSRNFGQHAAITAGLAESRGAYTVVMDCDLQDPPEQIERLWAKAHDGFDVVFTRRLRRRQSLARRVAAWMYFRTHRLLVKGFIHTDYANLSILSRKVVDAFLALRDRDRQYLLILQWLGFRSDTLVVAQDDRYAGHSSYTFRGLVRLAADGLFFQTTVLLRWIVYAGFLLAGAGAVLALYSFGTYAAGAKLPSWTALPMLILLLTGFMIISTGITGLYVGKIFEQVKGRPLYVVDMRVVGGRERSVAHELGGVALHDPAVGVGPVDGPTGREPLSS